MEYIAHYGIKGMKWGVRRYQNPDGSLTTAGKKHYNADSQRKDKIYSTQTPKGERVELHRNHGNALGKMVQRVSSRAKNEAEKSYNYDVRVNGKNVGVLDMYQKPNK